jgi:hypothetical protein
LRHFRIRYPVFVQLDMQRAVFRVHGRNRSQHSDPQSEKY